MNQNLTQKIQHDFDRLAMYEQEAWNHNNHYHSFLLKQLPSSCKVILDIGCGTGGFSRRLSQRADRVIALDLSPKSIEVAKQRSRQYTNINFQVADVFQWEFPQEEFDAIVSIATVHHLSVVDLLPKLKAALKLGGILAVLDLLQHESLKDIFSDLVAVPLNWWFLKTKNRNIKQSPEAIAAMQEHLRTDEYLTRSQVQKIYTDFLPEVTIKKHLFWRYSVVWQKMTDNP